MSRRVLVLACLAVVVLSGCTVVVNDSDGNGNANAIADRVETTLNETETLNATMIATTEVGNTTVTERVQLRYERPQHYNLTYLEVTNGSGEPIPNTKGDVVVANGTQLWAYDTANSTVTWLNDTRPRTLSELLMPSTQFGDNVTFAGNETVAGTDATKLSYAIDGSRVSLIAGDAQQRSRLEAAMNESTPVEATVWIDRDRWVPIKTRLTIAAFEDNVTITYRYENIQRNVDIDDGTFTPPPDASRATPWQDIEDRLGEYDSLSAMRADTNTSIPDPTVPDRFSFEWGNVTTVNDTERVLLFYGHGNVKLELVRWDNTSIDPLRAGERVQIGSTTGTFASLGQGRYVEWTCDGYVYLLSTRATSEEALETARSVGCS